VNGFLEYGSQEKEKREGSGLLATQRICQQCLNSLQRYALNVIGAPGSAEAREKMVPTRNQPVDLPCAGRRILDLGPVAAHLRDTLLNPQKCA
jgi:hypothetical protein